MKSWSAIFVVGALVLVGAFAWNAGNNSSHPADAQGEESTGPLGKPRSLGDQGAAPVADRQTGVVANPASTDGAGLDTGKAAATSPPPVNSRVRLETSLIAADGIKIQEANNLLNSARFEDVIRNISNGANAETLELTNIYRKDFSAVLSESEFRLQNVACGEYLCAAAFTGKPKSEDEFSNIVLDQGDAKSAPTGRPKVYAVLLVSVPPERAADPTEYRMIFTVDPKHKGLVGVP